MPITHWPRADRPREKLLEKGEHMLTDTELIAVLLNSGTRGKTAVDIARDMLNEFGSLKKLLSSSSLQIRKSGIGDAKYARLKAALELGRRYLAEQLPSGSVLNNSRMTQQFLANRLREYKNEVFACLFMDNHFRLLHYEELFHGTINEANIYPREIVRRGLLHNAAKIILAHNHPSGLAMPSKADKNVTLLIKQTLSLVDIEVVDHIIVGNPDNFSFAEAGIL